MARGFCTRGIPGGPVLWHDEILNHPQTVARGMVVRMPGEANALPLLGIPIKLSETPGSIRRRAPRLGEHADAVFNGKHFAETRPVRPLLVSFSHLQVDYLIMARPKPSFGMAPTAIRLKLQQPVFRFASYE